MRRLPVCNLLTALVAGALLLAACSLERAQPEPVAPPLPPVEEEHRHGVVFERMSEDDLPCVPYEIHTDLELTDYVLTMSGPDYELLMDCLSGEGRFEMFVLENSSMNLSLEENRCLWDGIQMMDRMGADRGLGSPGGASEDFILTSTAVAAFCMRSQGYIPGDWEPTPENEARRRAMVCMVEQSGGPGPFLTANMGAGVLSGALNEAMSGLGPCG